MSVIYSILCHEHPDSVVDMIRNIYYYHADISCTIVLNTNHALHAALKVETPSVFLTAPTNKRIYTYDIYDGHINNFVFCQTTGIRATYFIPLASNCMFHRPVTWPELTGTLLTAPAPPVESDFTTWHWPKFFKNNKIVKCLRYSGITMFNGNQHEGALLPYDTMVQIVDFTRSNNIKSKIQKETVFEEILLPTLYSHFTGKKLMSMCKVFWEKPGYTPSISEIEAESLPCVKRVDRKYSDPIRTWLRERANYYV